MVIAEAVNGWPFVHRQLMGEINAYPRAAPDYPWAAPDLTRWQRANCSLVMLQQTMDCQFSCIDDDTKERNGRICATNHIWPERLEARGWSAVRMGAAWVMDFRTDV